MLKNYANVPVPDPGAPMPFCRPFTVWLALAAAAAVAIAGCTSQPNPIIDTRGVNMEAYERDLADCTKYSEQVPVEDGMARGAATGAATGAAIGAIRDGDVVEDAAVGAVLGASKSGTDGAKEKE